MTEHALIGRQRETAWLAEAVSDALAGRGALVLLAGEAGVGKTHLAEAALLGAPLLRGAAQPPGAAAYGPVVAALRWRPARRSGRRSTACGPLRAHLAMLLPELGPPAPTSDRATMFEAIRCALRTLAPALVLLDDLQWSDGATLELLSALAAPLRELPLLVVAAYRSDEIGRGHPLRRLRADLRRGRLLRELVVAPLDQPASTELAARVLGGRPSPALAGALYDRTQGVPFFVQELAAALQAGDRVQRGRGGARARRTTTMCPVPETIRDAVLLRTAGLSPGRPRRPPRPRRWRAREFGARPRRRARRAARDRADRRRPSRAARRSATRSCAARSTRTSSGCAAASCTRSSPSG